MKLRGRRYLMQAASGGSKRVERAGSQELPLFEGGATRSPEVECSSLSKRYGSWDGNATRNCDKTIFTSNGLSLVLKIGRRL